MILARILDRRSKLASARCLRTETLTHTLGEELGIEDAGEEELYRAIDCANGRYVGRLSAYVWEQQSSLQRSTGCARDYSAMVYAIRKRMKFRLAYAASSVCFHVGALFVSHWFVSTSYSPDQPAL